MASYEEWLSAKEAVENSTVVKTSKGYYTLSCALEDVDDKDIEHCPGLFRTEEECRKVRERMIEHGPYLQF